MLKNLVWQLKAFLSFFFFFFAGEWDENRKYDDKRKNIFREMSLCLDGRERVY